MQDDLEHLKALIRHFEGLRLKVYLCPAGVATIGYGSTGPDIKMGMAPITEEEAESRMHKDAVKFYYGAAQLSPVLWLSGEKKHQAIADFCYNLGLGRYKASTLRKRVDAEDWDGACEELRKWVIGGGKRLPGLVRRREAEIALIQQ